MDMFNGDGGNSRHGARGFGTARLHRSGSQADAERIVLEAADAGFVHFDTAPLYGFGFAEQSMRVLARKADVSIATKVGLYPPGGAGQGRLATLARKVAGKALPRLSRAVASGSVARARQSLDDSLRRMARSHVDLLLLHEPQLALIDTDEWLRWIEDERARVGAFGLAGEAGDLLPFLAAHSPLAGVLQTRDALGEAQPLRDAGRSPGLLYGFSAIGDRDARAMRLREALGRAPGAIPVVSSRDPAGLMRWIDDAARPGG